jgi:uncharacterized protein (UPF0548 family)
VHPFANEDDRDATRTGHGEAIAERATAAVLPGIADRVDVLRLHDRKAPTGVIAVGN